MKIIALQAENFKKLKAIEIHPDPTMNLITGANAAGKSAVLDAIWIALAGADMSSSTGTVKPIRDGEEKASVRLDLGDIIVTRKWTKTGSYLSVESREGIAFKSPQSMLDAMIGKISFDPLSFANSDERTQRNTLLQIVKIGIDLAKNAADRQKAYDERTVTSRDVKAMEARLAGLPIAPAGTPEDEVSTEAILSEQQTALDIVQANQNQRAALVGLKNEWILTEHHEKETIEKIANLKKQLINEESFLAQWQLKEAEKRQIYDNENEVVEKLKDPDMQEFAGRLRDVEVINRNVRAQKARLEITTNLGTKEREVQERTKTIETLEHARRDAVRKAQFPITGLGFDDKGVTYNEMPFAQCSSAEKLRVSVAIAMATSPKLRIIRITDGSLIDNKNMAVIEEMAKANDFQCWIERVDESGKIGIYIEDGEVKTEKA